MIEPSPTMLVIETYGKSAEQLGKILSRGTHTQDIDNISKKVSAEARRIADFIVRKAAPRTLT